MSQNYKDRIAKEHGWRDWNTVPDSLKIKYFDEVIEDMELKITNHARNLVRVMRNRNSVSIDSFDVDTHSYPFHRLENALDDYYKTKM